MLSRAKMLQAL